MAAKCEEEQTDGEGYQHGGGHEVRLPKQGS